MQRKPTRKFKKRLHVCAYHCAQLSYTTQHRTVLITFPPNLQTIVIALMSSTGGKGENLEQHITTKNCTDEKMQRLTVPYLAKCSFNCDSVMLAGRPPMKIFRRLFSKFFPP